MNPRDDSSSSQLQGFRQDLTEYLEGLEKAFNERIEAVGIDFSKVPTRILKRQYLKGLHPALSGPLRGKFRACYTTREDQVDFCIVLFGMIKDPQERKMTIITYLTDVLLGERCYKEMLQDLLNFLDKAEKPVAQAVLALALEARSKRVTREQLLDFLMSRLNRRTLDLYFPDDDQSQEKESFWDEWINKKVHLVWSLPIDETFAKAFEGELEYLPQEARNAFIDEQRKQEAKKRRPPGGYLYPDAWSDDGAISYWDALVAKCPELHIRLEKPALELTAKQEAQLEQLLGSKNQVALLKFIYHPEAEGATDAEIAERMGWHRTRISKCRKIFKELGDEIKEILDLK